MSDVIKAERALHRRAGLACAAAAEAGVPGEFRVWEQDGLLAVRVTSPTLGFLSTVSGVTAENLPTATNLAPQLIVSTELDQAGLPAAGLIRAADRPLAIRRLAPPPAAADPDVIDADAGFLDVLLAGYEVDGVIAAFIRAEHRLPAVRKFLVLDHGEPIGAAAMTIHDDVAVLGGAATPRAHRGRGAQSRLLRHRLRLAADAGCGLAVATARPGSVSAANLRRAGFQLHQRAAWTKA